LSIDWRWRWLPATVKPWGQTVAFVRDPAGFLVEIASFPPASTSPA
jgi:hypothetical protein